MIEMASASGLHLVPAGQRDPRFTTSFGTGELILDALQLGAETMIIGIGGSATNDGGAGMMQALGARLLDKQGEPLAAGGEALLNLHQIDMENVDPRLLSTELRVACDVDNPLCGVNGASAVFGPQKGATPEMVKQLDAALRCWGELIFTLTGQSVAELPGAGAAGGVGAALSGLLGGKLEPGIKIVTDALHLAQHIQGADLVITGEGRIDSQSIHGKTPIGVAQVAAQFSVPAIALVGGMAKDYAVVHQHGLAVVLSVVNRIVSFSEAMEEAADNLRVTARNVAAVWQLASKETSNVPPVSYRRCESN
ncbi:MAG: Glycerate 2-kinase [Candidatus Erwinia impunctatus]